jgi:hypothetical protein
MGKIRFVILFCLFLIVTGMPGQTVIPNAGFENWTQFSNYSNPTGWDTPNEELMSIPFFGFQVVTKSTDHQGSGSFSVKLETKHLAFPSMDIPGFMTCGNITVNITSGTFVLSGGVPVVDIPTHLKGFYKYSPKGGDTCVIGIGLTKTTGGVQDTVGLGYFSTKDTVTDWTPFSAWINYVSSDQPDTMNIIAMSTAQEVMTPGTVLYVDNLYLDYTVRINENDPAASIQVYNDRETSRLMVFFDFPKSESTCLKLINMRGQCLYSAYAGSVGKDRRVIPYENMYRGIYVLEVLHGNKVFTKKIFLNQ